jgi:hypothetical protein
VRFQLFETPGHVIELTHQQIRKQDDLGRLNRVIELD